MITSHIILKDMFRASPALGIDLLSLNNSNNCNEFFDEFEIGPFTCVSSGRSLDEPIESDIEMIGRC